MFITSNLKITDEQLGVLERKFERANSDQTKQEFFDSVQPTIGCDDAVTVKWCGMYLCIETDGYCHS
tara:strand:- start:655 stop:855 length:201 start_codon:yes stop_codon:yes gene_type:complete